MEFFELECGTTAEETTRTFADWPDWEHSRTRSFLSAATKPLDTKGKVGSIRNMAVELVKKRTATGFEATWAFSCDLKIGPYHVVPNNVVVLSLKGGGNVLHKQKLAGFARTCGGWTNYSWNGVLPPEAFEPFDGFSLDAKNVEGQKC